MNCRQFKELYTDFADEALDEATEIAARRHLSVCPSCRRIDQAFRAGLIALRSLPPLRASEDFGYRLRERIRLEGGQAGAAGRDPGRSLRQFAGLAAALAVVVTAGVTAVKLTGPDQAATGVREPPRAGRAAPARAEPRARFVHDTSFGRDPFRVLPSTRDTLFFPAPRHFEITVDWMSR